MSTKKQNLIELAKKKGNDSDLMLLDMIHELQDEIGELKKKINEDIKDTRTLIGDLGGIERLKGEKGDEGKTATDEELLALIKPLIPKVSDGKTPTANELLALIKPLIPKVKDGETPSDKRLSLIMEKLLPKQSDIIQEVIKKIPEPEQVMKDSPEEIRNKLELLTEDERLDAKAIKGLEEYLKDNALGKVIMTGQNPSSIIELIATGNKDGSNKNFIFAQKPRFIIINGAMYRESNGWSWGANDTATLDFAPLNDDDVYGIL